MTDKPCGGLATSRIADTIFLKTMKTKKILVIPVMVMMYLITMAVIIIGSPLWAFGILSEAADNSTQSNALGRL